MAAQVSEVPRFVHLSFSFCLNSMQVATCAVTRDVP
jgi:hypothetical protein